MPIYMKFDGIVGPVTYDKSKGWIELESVQLGQHRSIRSPTGSARERESQSPNISEIVATKYQDSSSTALFKQALWGEGKKVTIVFVKIDKDSSQEYLRIILENTLISSFTTSGSGGADRPMESFTLNFTKITFEKGSSAHASLMVRPQDWGSLQAMAMFNRSTEA